MALLPANLALLSFEFPPCGARHPRARRPGRIASGQLVRRSRASELRHSPKGARAAGDVLDMAAVAPQLASKDESVQRANSFAALAIGAIAALDVYCAIKLAQQ